MEYIRQKQVVFDHNGKETKSEHVGPIKAVVESSAEELLIGSKEAIEEAKEKAKTLKGGQTLKVTIWEASSKEEKIAQEKAAGRIKDDKASSEEAAKKKAEEEEAAKKKAEEEEAAKKKDSSKKPKIEEK